MSDIIKASSDLDYSILKNSKKEIFDSYTAGQRVPKTNPFNDLDYMAQLNKSFFQYIALLINQLPENEQTEQRIKCRLVQDQIETALKGLSFGKNILDKNNFLFYNVAYVSDIIKRNSGINNEG